VVGECRRHAAVVAEQGRIRIQGGAVRGVQHHQLTGEHVVVDRVAGQLVPERVAVTGGVDDQQMMLDGLAQGGTQVRLGHAGHRREQPVIDARPGRRGGLQYALRRLRHGLGAGQQHVAQRRGQVTRVGAAVHRGDDLLDQEGVALRPLEHHCRERRRRMGVADGVQLRHDLVAGEAAELDALDGAHPLPGGQQRPQFMAAVQLVRPVRQQQKDAELTQGPDEEHHDVAGGPVGPVEVLDDQQQRLPRGQPGDQPEDVFQQPRRRALGGGHPGDRRVELGQQPGELPPGRAEQPIELGGRGGPGQCPEHVHQRREGEAFAAELRAAAAEYAHSRRGGRPGQLPHQAGLADAGLAAEQCHRGSAADGLIEQGAQPRELVAAADEDGANDVTAHHVKLGARRAYPDRRADSVRISTSVSGWPCSARG
jgi:hypothetical protein